LSPAGRGTEESDEHEVTERDKGAFGNRPGRSSNRRESILQHSATLKRAHIVLVYRFIVLFWESARRELQALV